MTHTNIPSQPHPEETHYILVVHGTWNPPREGERLWYQLDEADSDNFCRQLNDRLEENGLGRAVWRSCNGESTDFAWSGANHHKDRLIAAKQLAKRIVEIAAKDPTARIHLVAHSHGGNVALAAFQLYLSYLESQSQVVWRFNDAGHRAVGNEFFEGPPDELSPLHLPPVEDSAKTFDPGNAELMRRRWHEASDEYRRDTGFGAVGTPNFDEFKSWWLQSPKYNRLGKLVFLGTPFFYKQWFSGEGPPHLWFRMRWFNAGLEFAGWLAMLMVFLYAVIEVGWHCFAARLTGLH